MKIELRTYTVRELVEGFVYSSTESKGLYGLDGGLVIQPEYQRNYLYGSGKYSGMDEDVARSLLNGWPVGLLYFVQRDDGQMEVLDGQQRITSIGRFCTDGMAVEVGGVRHFMSSLGREDREALLDSEIVTYICRGTEREIKDWFRTINIAGIPLNDQELLNAVYAGPMVTAARAIFSDPQSSKLPRWQRFVRGDVRRQEVLKTALNWISAGREGEWMAAHREDAAAAGVLLRHFEDVVAWAESLFGDVSPWGTGLDWGDLHRRFGKQAYRAGDVRKRSAELLQQEAVTSKKGVFEYVLGGERVEDAKLLNIRIFEEGVKRAAWDAQTVAAQAAGESNCPMCALSTDQAVRTRTWSRKQMEADHVTAWSNGGASDRANCQMLCITHNKMKGNK